MGYYTRHTLTIVSGNDEVTDYAAEISEASGYDNCFDEELKWYDHEEDMRKYSEKHPDVLFLLEGDGEENGDQWIEYYQNGKSQRCPAIITFEEYDPLKME